MISDTLTENILRLCHEGKALARPESGGVLPDPADPALTPLDGTLSLTLPQKTLRERLDDLLPGTTLPLPDADGRGMIRLDSDRLTGIGIQLFPLFAQGVLSGGSATSYADHIRNQSLSGELYRFYSGRFEKLYPVTEGRAKGIVPAFYGSDGQPGPSFLEIKIASWLKTARICGDTTGVKVRPPLPPVFLMTSTGTADPVAEACERYVRTGPVSRLFAETGMSPFVPSSEIQPMIAALTHSADGLPRRVFTGRSGTPDGRIPLPGGHGMCFSVWKERLGLMESAGFRFVSIGNVDNLGYTFHPAGTAVLALSGAEAAFDFSRKTAVDVKGGILVKNREGRLVTLEIGSGISSGTLREGEAKGQPVLFNCATGLFDLRYLNRHIDRIASGLPVRLSDQVKDSGCYAQAEQNTWDVMGLLDDIKIFTVDKYDRFLAAKLLLETFLTSGLDTGKPGFPESFRTLSDHLSAGLARKIAFLKFYSDNT